MSNSNFKIFSTSELLYLSSGNSKINLKLLEEIQHELNSRKVSKTINEMFFNSTKWMSSSESKVFSLKFLDDQSILLEMKEEEKRIRLEKYNNLIEKNDLNIPILNTAKVRTLIFVFSLLSFLGSFLFDEYSILSNLFKIFVAIGIGLLFYLAWQKDINDSLKKLNKNRKLIFRNNDPDDMIQCFIYESGKIINSIFNIEKVTLLWFNDLSQEPGPIKYDLWLQLSDKDQKNYNVYEFDNKYELFEIVNALSLKFNLALDVKRTYKPPELLF